MEQKRSLYKILQVAIFIFSYQVGCGVFFLPSPLSECGYSSIFILLFLGILCILLSKVYSNTGKSSQEIICEAFGEKISSIFFILYCISYWLCTVVYFKELVGYLKCDPITGIYIQIIVCFVIVVINLWSFKQSMIIEIFISFLKFIPFVGLLIGYFATETVPVNNSSFYSIKASLLLRCFYCYIGLETGTIVAKNLNATPDERKRGMSLGMISVIAFYMLGVFFCFSICGTEILHCNSAPYVTVFQNGLSRFLTNDIIAFSIKSIIITCLLGSINTFTLGNGYMAYEGGVAGTLPKFFKKRNKYNVPYAGLALTSLFVITIVLLSYNPNIYAGTLLFVDISCCFFFLVYAVCLLSYGKVYLKSYKKIVYYIVSFLFFSSFIYGLFTTLKVNLPK